MALWDCPHCKNGGTLFTCKECQTVICINCKRTLQGDKFKTPINQCPTCKQWTTLERNDPNAK